MRKYFYANGQEKHGPFSFEELKHNDIKSDTLIWYEGLTNWEPANKVEEMREIIELVPPPLGLANSSSISLLENSSEEKDKTPFPQKQKMFSKLFQPEGRIRRTEYILSLIFYYVGIILIGFSMGLLGLTDGETYGVGFLYLAILPLLVLFLFQGAKRCHDRGNSGWFQIIPFYIFWMVFAPSEIGKNKYGRNPKGQ